MHATKFGTIEQAKKPSTVFVRNDAAVADDISQFGDVRCVEKFRQMGAFAIESEVDEIIEEFFKRKKKTP